MQRDREALLSVLKQRQHVVVMSTSHHQRLDHEIKRLKDRLEKAEALFNEREALIESMEVERKRLKSSLAKTSDSLNEMTLKFEELQDELRALMLPPLDFAIVVRINDDDTVDVMLDGHRKRVGVHPSVEQSQLHVGQRVILNGKSLTVQSIADDILSGGAPAHLSEWVGNTMALVEDTRGDKRVVLAGEGITPATIEVGTEVLIEESVIVRPVRSTSHSSSLGAGSRFLLAEMPDVTFDDIGGLDDELARIVASIENPQRVPEAYAALKRKPTFSVILLGLPGNGKTMIAKAIARRQFDLHRQEILKHAKGNFFAVGGTELFTKWLGDTERFLREIVQAAQKLYELSGAVSTIFFDDCESFFLTRSAGLSTNINGSVVTQFSTLIEGVRELRGVNLIAATNRLDLMDPAVVRRFDRQVRIKTPDTQERASAVLQKHLRDVPLDKMSVEEATQKLVGDIFANTRENEIVEIVFQDSNEDPKRVHLFELISGKFLRDIVERAKDLAIERGLASGASTHHWAISLEDLRASLHSELRNKESLPVTLETIREWLMQRGDKREVDYVTSLRDARKSETRRNSAIDERVV